MKVRKTFSVILCVVFIAITSMAYFLLHNLKSTPRGLNTSSFAPAKVKISDKEDITVKVYPTGGIMRHAPEYYEDYEVSLNKIKKGWIVAQYQGYCRLLFEPEDADLEEIYEIYGGEVQYYYAEKIPSTSLRVTDMSARRADDAKDPFGVEYRPVYMYYSIAEEKDEYYSSKYGALCYLAVDLVVVALVVGVNLLINRKTK